MNNLPKTAREWLIKIAFAGCVAVTLGVLAAEALYMGGVRL